MRGAIEEILEKYSSKCDGYCYYKMYYYDDSGEEHTPDNEIIEEFVKHGVEEYEVSIEECYNSCSYGCSMLIAAWIDNGKLETEYVLLESY